MIAVSDEIGSTAPMFKLMPLEIWGGDLMFTLIKQMMGFFMIGNKKNWNLHFFALHVWRNAYNLTKKGIYLVQIFAVHLSGVENWHLIAVSDEIGPTTWEVHYGPLHQCQR